MHAKGPLDAPVTPRSIVGGATWGLRNGFDVAPRGARAPHARSRARPFPVTARFGHPLLENRFPSHLFRVLSLGVKPAGRPSKLPALDPVFMRFLDKSKIWLELRVGIAFAYHDENVSRQCPCIESVRTQLTKFHHRALARVHEYRFLKKSHT